MKKAPVVPANLAFDGPASYRIVVQGTLDENWSERFAGMTVSVVRTAAGSSRTELTGPLLDQAALQGVLETLYGLHMAILNVEKIDDPQQESNRQRNTNQAKRSDCR